MNLKVNFNEAVKVKLTPLGLDILKKQRDELNKIIQARGGKGLGEYKHKVDDEGYSSFQIWSLMNHFGPYMQLGYEPPFMGDIIICNGELIDD